MKTLTWKNFHEYFPEFEILNEGNEIAVATTRISRFGLELSGYVSRSETSAIFLLGNEEYKYLLNFSKKEIKEKLSKIFKLNPPLIVLSRSFDFSLIENLVKEYQITVFKSNLSSAVLSTTINLMLLNYFSKVYSIHANLVEIYGLGVLILGESGIGKSEITIELIKKGHLFIADDAVEYYKVFDKLIGKPVDSCRNFIEVRGLGVLNVEKLYGVQSVKEQSYIDVIIELSYDIDSNFERIGNELRYKKMDGIAIPFYKIPVSSGRKISEIIEVIVCDLKLKKSGYSSSIEFNKSIINSLKK